MKKLLTIFAILSAFAVNAQNLQLHRDLERGHFTTTFEMFKMDKWGNTFTFIDFDYDAENGINQGYFEIARVLKTEKMPIGLHVEYNGGVGNAGQVTEFPIGLGYTINNAWIFGANYSQGSAKWGFSTYAGYKSIKDADKANFQVTGTWYVNMLDGKMTFSGFADLWTEKGLNDNTIFLAEPQLWYNVNKQFSFGGELELSNNFAGVEEFKVRPTLAVKWNF